MELKSELETISKQSTMFAIFLALVETVAKKMRLEIFAFSENVFTNSAKTVRVGDTTSCGDPATAGSATVFANGIAVHRKGDATGGHGSWVPNASASGSANSFAGP